MIKNKFFTSLLILPILFLCFLPTTVLAQWSPDTGITYECVDSNGVYGNCTFNDLLEATKKVVNWGVGFALFFSVIVIAYAGYKYLISGDKPGERSKANQMLQKVGIGIAWVIAAWLIVNLITTELLGKGFDTIFK